jgi:predicted nucleic acid-binding Zn ribbon protein
MRKAGEVVSALFQERFGPEFMESARLSAGLFSSWDEIVAEVWPLPGESDPGFKDLPAAAAHSRIRELERGVLLVEADHPGWVQILLTKQKELLLAVQRRNPELSIRGIAFRLSREPFPSMDAKSQESSGASASVGHVAPPEIKTADEAPLSVHHAGGKLPRDEEFYAALKGLEESIKKRNGL